MLEARQTVTINAPADVVWQTLAKLDAVSSWSQAVTKTYLKTSKAQGVGAERVCEVAGLGTLTERVVHWNEGEALSCEISGMPWIVRSAESSWQLESTRPHLTTLTVVMIIETRLGVIGSLMEKSLLAPKIHATLRDVVAQFKHYVEARKPLFGRAASLTQANAP
jgi:uncharacterized membrane protein